jgi:hypothetical protein
VSPQPQLSPRQFPTAHQVCSDDGNQCFGTFSGFGEGGVECGAWTPGPGDPLSNCYQAERWQAYGSWPSNEGSFIEFAAILANAVPHNRYPGPLTCDQAKIALDVVFKGDMAFSGSSGAQIKFQYEAELKEVRPAGPRCSHTNTHSTPTPPLLLTV